MKVHIVFAHPNVRSYNGQLRNKAIQTLEYLGHTVSVSDLYQMKFKAAADELDFTDLFNDDFFDLQAEQQLASQHHTFSEDIDREQRLLSDADIILFQFPLWWYSMPALLKGYFDRVFSFGWAYGSKQALAEKKVLVSITTGAPEFTWTEEKRGTIKDIFKHMFVGVFGLCGMHVLEPFIVYGAKRQSPEDKETTLRNFEKRLNELVM